MNSCMLHRKAPCRSPSTERRALRRPFAPSQRTGYDTFAQGVQERGSPEAAVGSDRLPSHPVEVCLHNVLSAFPFRENNHSTNKRRYGKYPSYQPEQFEVLVSSLSPTSCAWRRHAGMLACIGLRGALLRSSRLRGSAVDVSRFRWRREEVLDGHHATLRIKGENYWKQVDDPLLSCWAAKRFALVARTEFCSTEPVPVFRPALSKSRSPSCYGAFSKTLRNATLLLEAYHC